MDTPAATPADSRATFLGWITALVHGQRARLAGLARRRGLPPEEALDCVQDAFFAFLGLPDADQLAARPVDAGRVLSALVANGAANRRRRLAVRARLEAPVELEAEAELPSAEALVERAEARAHLIRCVDRLGQMQRAVVQLRLVDDRPGEEVSRALGLSPENVRVLLFRARARLRECLELSAALDGPQKA